MRQLSLWARIFLAATITAAQAASVTRTIMAMLPCDCAVSLYAAARAGQMHGDVRDSKSKKREAGMGLSPRATLARMLLMRRFEEMVITLARAHKLGRQHLVEYEVHPDGPFLLDELDVIEVRAEDQPGDAG